MVEDLVEASGTAHPGPERGKDALGAERGRPLGLLGDDQAGANALAGGQEVIQGAVNAEQRGHAGQGGALEELLASGHGAELGDVGGELGGEVARGGADQPRSSVADGAQLQVPVQAQVHVDGRRLRWAGWDSAGGSRSPRGTVGWSGPDLDPELVRAERLQPHVPFTDPLRARRAFARAVAISRQLRSETPTPEVATDDVLLTPAGRVPMAARVYRPTDAGADLSGLLHLHGGAFVAGDLDTEHDRCAFLAVAARCVIISVDYRRPPEHPYPVPTEDCYAALQAVSEDARSFGADTARLAVGGNSAGGTLAAAVALMARDRGGPTLALQLLYPALDDRLTTDSMLRYPRSSSWTHEDSEHMWAHYLGPGRGSEQTYAVSARHSPLRGVAPAYLLVAEVDALRDEALDYAVRLMQDGVPVELNCVSGAFHGFDLAAPTASSSRVALGDQAAVLRSAFTARLTAAAYATEATNSREKPDE